MIDLISGPRTKLLLCQVRCNSRRPCENCSQAGILCTYDTVPQRKGPKGSRAKVISELRQTQRKPELAHSTSASGSPPGSPGENKTFGLLTQEINEQCIDFFFVHIYPTMPVLTRHQMEQTSVDMDQSVEAYCLLSSLSAFMIIQPGMEQKPYQPSSRSPSSSTNAALGISLMEEAIRVRKTFDYVEAPSVAAVITSFFLFGCCLGRNKHNTAWIHLREATALAQILGMQEETTYLRGDPLESLLKRRLFWLLFVTERYTFNSYCYLPESADNRRIRAYALQKHRPVTLHATIELPILDLDPSNSIAGFCYLVNLYQPFDDVFMSLWNKTRTDCTTFRLAQMQQQILEALPVYLDTTESQAADLRTSQHWLRTMVWQLSIANGCLSSTSPDASMTFTYPIEIAKDLVAVTDAFSQQSMEVHGIGLVRHLLRHD